MRTDGDQWGIAESVGVTALGVAIGRAIETGRSDGLVRDPYAEEFADAAAARVPLPPNWRSDPRLVPLSTHVGVRSLFFDRFCTQASAAGINQTVILAAGLDTRALRLDWPPHSAVFEIDQPGVLEFKNQVLADRHAHSSARRLVVPVDLRADWPAALRTVGFDPTRPSAWLAEGLLPFLPAQAEIDLFNQVHELSTRASRFAIAHVDGPKAEMAAKLHPMTEVFGVDPFDLMYLDDREDPGDRLRRYGWDVTHVRASELAHANGRHFGDNGEDQARHTLLIEATRR